MSIKLLGVIGWIFFIKSSIIRQNIHKQIKRNAALKDALNNEMHRLYGLKSTQVGFFTFFISIIVFIFASFFTKLELRLALEIILYFGTLATFITGLVLNKN